MKIASRPEKSFGFLIFKNINFREQISYTKRLLGTMSWRRLGEKWIFGQHASIALIKHCRHFIRINALSVLGNPVFYFETCWGRLGPNSESGAIGKKCGTCLGLWDPCFRIKKQGVRCKKNVWKLVEGISRWKKSQFELPSFGVCSV